MRFRAAGDASIGRGASFNACEPRCEPPSPRTPPPARQARRAGPGAVPATLADGLRRAPTRAGSHEPPPERCANPLGAMRRLAPCATAGLRASPEGAKAPSTARRAHAAHEDVKPGHDHFKVVARHSPSPRRALPARPALGCQTENPTIHEDARQSSTNTLSATATRRRSVGFKEAATSPFPRRSDAPASRRRQASPVL
jgi:hypothetical protein